MDITCYLAAVMELPKFLRYPSYPGKFWGSLKLGPGWLRSTLQVERSLVIKAPGTVQQVAQLVAPCKREALEEHHEQMLREMSQKMEAWGFCIKSQRWSIKCWDMWCSCDAITEAVYTRNIMQPLPGQLHGHNSMNLKVWSPSIGVSTCTSDRSQRVGHNT